MLLKRNWQKRLKTRILNYHNADYGDYFLGHEAAAPPKANACAGVRELGAMAEACES
jgi:hypothetical protein